LQDALFFPEALLADAVEVVSETLAVVFEHRRGRR
jgi:hypothetical protein